MVHIGKIMANYYVIVFSVITLAAGENIQFKGCPDADAKGLVLPTSVDISPCPVQPCVFKHGDTANVSIGFDATDAQASLKAAIYGYILNVAVPFNMPNSDGCKDCGIGCPVTKGQSYTYKSTFQVLPSYPTIKVIVEWKLDGTSANGTKNDFCFTFPVDIQ